MPCRTLDTLCTYSQSQSVLRSVAARWGGTASKAPVKCTVVRAVLISFSLSLYLLRTEENRVSHANGVLRRAAAVDGGEAAAARGSARRREQHLCVGGFVYFVTVKVRIYQQRERSTESVRVLPMSMCPMSSRPARACASGKCRGLSVGNEPALAAARTLRRQRGCFRQVPSARLVVVQLEAADVEPLAERAPIRQVPSEFHQGRRPYMAGAGAHGRLVGPAPHGRQ